ncbi:hypothetical protein P20652_2442 [Pseudoalteromonas sp. BSi20652]|uniref:hypothetical protein n=1 Tax=Pseudoalteromonas sp. BSi20652 TaxID=388384 RepID=UPI000231867D|nr:hypothetical protein [Pseudoalteromonas sp. BSi20652]GAA60576.1 hypothetical protein P20652_2442 [Pseudoalteromonas sp. BSi20652]
MINLNELPTPIHLDDLEKLAPAAFEELVRMNIIHRSIVLAWLNGRSTSPVGRGYADVEIDKEDAKHSHLKMKYFIDYRSKPELGRKVSHLMTEKQRLDFFNNRDSQRERVKCRVKKERVERWEKSLIKIYEHLGLERIKSIIATEHFKNTCAANDPIFDKEKPTKN